MAKKLCDINAILHIMVSHDKLVGFWHDKSTCESISHTANKPLNAQPPVKKENPIHALPVAHMKTKKR